MPKAQHGRPDTGEVRATWEPDPLGRPGLFADLVEAQWHVQEINNLVQVESVKLLDASAACPPGDVLEEEESEDPFDTLAVKPMPPITFYPDGSSDSAEIIVAARSPEEEQRMAVRLVGLTGSISRQPVASDLENALWDTELADQPELVPERTFTPDFKPGAKRPRRDRPLVTPAVLRGRLNPLRERRLEEQTAWTRSGKREWSAYDQVVRSTCE